MIETGSSRHGEPRIRGAQVIALALLAWGLWVVVRATGPEDLCTRDQERAAAYVLDITENGEWLLQRDFRGNVASKPPLPNWLAATASLAAGRVERLWLGFPAWFATGLTSLGIAVVTSWFAGRRAALFAVPLYLCSQLGLRQVYLVRSDPVFQCGVFFAAMALFRWWNAGRGRWAFGLAATVAVLAKGPLGLLFAIAGLGALIWERRTDPDPRIVEHRPTRRFEAIPTMFAIGLPLLVPAIWFALADWTSDGAAWSKLIDDELVGHAQGKGDRVPFERPFHPIGWFLTRAAPLGPIALLAILELVRKPSRDPERRRMERFLTSFIVVLLLLLAAAGNKRFVHLLPALPIAAILGARYIDRHLPTASRRRAPQLVLGAILVSSSLAAVYLNALDDNDDLRKARAVREITGTVETRLGRDFPLFLDAGAPDLALIQLDRFAEVTGELRVVPDPDGPEPNRVVVDRERGIALLRSNAAVFLLTDDPAFYLDRLRGSVHRVLRHSGRAWAGELAIVSNRDQLAWPTEGPIATPEGRRITVDGGRILRKEERRLTVLAERPDARLILERDRLDGRSPPSDRESVPLLPMRERLTPVTVSTSIDGDGHRSSDAGVVWFLLSILGSLGFAAWYAIRRIDASKTA